MIVGHQIAFVRDVLKARRRPFDAGPPSAASAKRIELANQFGRIVMQIVVSLAVLGVALWLLVSSDNEATQKLASGLVGSILGYWLR